MAHILYAYTVSVTPRGDTRERRLLGNFDEGGASLLSELTTFLKQTKKKDWMDRSINSAVRIDQVYPPDKKNHDVVAAMARVGEMGLESDFYDTSEEEIGTEVLFERGDRHAELVPALLLAKLPADRASGYLIVHSPHRRGIKTKFFSSFEEWINQRHGDYIVRLDTAFPENMYRQLLEKEQLKKVTLIRRVRPSDATDEERSWFTEEEMGTITTTLVPKRNKPLSLRKQALVNALDDSSARSDLLIFAGETYDEIRVTVRSRKKYHSINLEGGHRGRPGYDVTESLKMDKRGHATYDSLRTAALNYLDILGS